MSDFSKYCANCGCLCSELTLAIVLFERIDENSTHKLGLVPSFLWYLTGYLSKKKVIFKKPGREDMCFLGRTAYETDFELVAVLYARLHQRMSPFCALDYTPLIPTGHRPIRLAASINTSF